MGKVSLLLLVALLVLCGVKSDSEKMKIITIGFMNALDECKKELNLSDHIIKDLYSYWQEDYKLLNRETGCAIHCMSTKLDLIDPSGKLHHGKAEEFAKRHGADDDMASQLMKILKECESNFHSIADDCDRTLEIAKCFRTRIHELKWAPTFDVIIEEVLTEI